MGISGIIWVLVRNAESQVPVPVLLDQKNAMSGAQPWARLPASWIFRGGSSWIGFGKQQSRLSYRVTSISTALNTHVSIMSGDDIYWLMSFLSTWIFNAFPMVDAFLSTVITFSSHPWCSLPYAHPHASNHSVLFISGS